jgi:acetoin utilization deacetylase AcuC-like enzyme
MLHISWSPTYIYELPEGHRFPMQKYELIPAQLLYEGSITTQNIFQPEPLDEPTVLLTHTKEYYDKMTFLTLTTAEERAIGFPITEKFILRGRHISSGTIQCTHFARLHGVSMNIAGGTHHAFANRGEGYCCLNDQAIASNYLLHNGLSKKIMIVDLDVHQGNGTASIFENEPRVFTFSMHGARNYPFRKEKSTLDIGLADGTDGPTYLSILYETLPRIMAEFQPDFVFYQSGVDVLATDKIGRLKLTREDCKERDRFVLDFCYRNKLPVVVCMGGGYSTEINDIVEAHANTFRVAQEIYF